MTNAIVLTAVPYDTIRFSSIQPLIQVPCQPGSFIPFVLQWSFIVHSQLAFLYLWRIRREVYCWCLALVGSAILEAESYNKMGSVSLADMETFHLKRHTPAVYGKQCEAKCEWPVKED